MVSTRANDLVIDDHQFDGQVAAAAPNTITQTQASPTPSFHNDPNLTLNSPNEATPVRDIRTCYHHNEFTDEDVKKCHTHYFHLLNPNHAYLPTTTYTDPSTDDFATRYPLPHAILNYLVEVAPPKSEHHASDWSVETRMALFPVILKHLRESILHFDDSIVHPTLDLSLILGLELDPSGFEHYEVTIRRNTSSRTAYLGPQEHVPPPNPTNTPPLVNPEMLWPGDMYINPNYNLFIECMKLNHPAGWKAIKFFHLILKKCMMLDMSSSSLQAFGGFHNLAKISARARIKMQSSGTGGDPDDDGGGDDGNDDDSINSDLSLDGENEAEDADTKTDDRKRLGVAYGVEQMQLVVDMMKRTASIINDIMYKEQCEVRHLMGVGGEMVKAAQAIAKMGKAANSSSVSLLSF
jgi:hypothetical protein